MKIRILASSLRYRLSKSEVAKLCTEKYIESITEFNSATLTYCIQVAENSTELSADFENNKITLYFPSIEAAVWHTSDRITYENYITLHNGNKLKLLLEKDFVCLDHSTEDQSDNYENPNKTC
jgi:hypothetical protein